MENSLVDYKQKYLKYKAKYLELKSKLDGNGKGICTKCDCRRFEGSRTNQNRCWCGHSFNDHKGKKLY